MEVCVQSIREVEQAIKDHELNSSTRYITQKTYSLFGKEDINFSNFNFDIRFEDTQKNIKPFIHFDGVPFIIVGKKVMECHQAKDRNKKKKENYAKKKKSKSKVEHSYDKIGKSKKRAQETKKKDCSAKLKIRHIIKFPDFQVSCDAKRCEKDHTSYRLRAALTKPGNVQYAHQFFISFPMEEEHSNHFKGEASALIQPIDKEISSYIDTMVLQHNITSPSVMRIMLEVYVKQTLFRDQPLPSKMNKRYWPSNKDIRNHIAQSLIRVRNNNVDQAVVEDLVRNWKENYPGDNFFLRTKEIKEDDVIDSKDEIEQIDDEEDMILGDSFITSNKNKFLFIHQSQEQKRLLDLYGHEICLMDATYRTTKYALPLYFICVPTNVNYVTVATFITETEDTGSLTEALSILKSWNEGWKPSFFMCDYADEEINSLEAVFPDAFVYLCDFHREQAWERWLSAAHNGLIAKKTDVLSLLRPLASSSTVEEYERARDVLLESSFWKENQKLQNWFQRRWLNKHQRWVNAYRQNRFNISINTNNGIERQNATLKYEYLQSKKASSLSHLLQVIIENFNPDSYRKYLLLNVKASDQARTYSSSIPAFLHNRPPQFVRHCFQRWEDSGFISIDDIDTVDEQDGLFLVKSQSNSSLVYLVKFKENDIGLPSCDCPDWKATHIPCKHFLAVMRNIPDWSWESLPKDYIHSPFLNLDLESISQVSKQGTEFKEREDDHDEFPSEISGQQTTGFEDLPITSAASLKQKRGRLLNLCTILKDLSYRTKDGNALDEAVECLSTAIDVVEKTIPRSKEFLLDDGEMVKKKNKTKAAIPKKMGNLKKNPPRRKGLKRVGKKAEQQRNSFTRKGALEILNEDKELKEQQNLGADNLFNEFKDFINDTSKNAWKDLFQLAEDTKHLNCDMTSQVGFSVLFQVCHDSTDLIANLMQRLSCLMPTAAKDDTKARLIHLILEEMVLQEKIFLDEKNDPHVKAAEREKAMQELLSNPIFKSVQPKNQTGRKRKMGPIKPIQIKRSRQQSPEPNYLGVQDKTAENAPAEICLDADNEQNCDISKDVLEKFTEFLKAVEISAMIQEAKETSHIGRDLIRRVGDAVLYQSSNPMELLIKMKGLLDEDLEDTIKQRFISIALNHLVMKGQLILPEEVDPRLQEARIENLIQHLLQGAKESYSTRLIEDQRPIKKTPTVMTNTKRRVEFTEEAKKFKQRKMMALQKSCPDPFPGGGLLNPPRKNLCYANSLLQCLRLTDIHTLLQHHRNCEASESCFTCGLKDFFENAPITAEPLCERMTTFWSDYTVGRQQDCHELYYKMMNEIQEKCLRWMNLSDQKRIFYGELQYSYTCKACGYQSCNTETFSNLSVSIEQHQTVTQCLDGYFRDEHLDKQCVRCGINREFLRKTELTDIPKNLVIQLQRVSARRTKIMKKIDLHLNLNLRMHVVKDKELEHKLDLFGVIVHKGQTLKVGHYIAMVKFGTDWYRVDDMKVTKISASGLKNIDGQSTLLFYRTLPRPYIS